MDDLDLDLFGGSAFTEALPGITTDPLLEPAPEPFRTSLDPALVVEHAVPHCVLPQLLRPLVAAFVSPSAIAVRTVADAVPCVTNLRVDSDMAPALRYASALPHLTAVSAAYNKKLHTEHLAPFATVGAFQELRTLDFRCCVELTNHAIQSVSALRHLTSLELESCRRLTAAVFPHLSGMTCLEVLSVAIVDATDHDVVSLAPLQQLRVLKVGVPSITRRGLAALCCFPLLRDLGLFRIRTDHEALQVLAPLASHLRCLRLYHAFVLLPCDDLDTPLSVFAELEVLVLRCCSADLYRIPTLPKLKELVFTTVGPQHSSAGDAAATKQLLSLEKLDLSMSNATRQIVSAFSHLANLSDLRMPTNAPLFLAELVNLPRLRKLTMGQPSGPEDCPHFAHLRALEDLQVEFPSDLQGKAEVLTAVALVPRLRTLTLSKTCYRAAAHQIDEDDIRPLLRCAHSLTSLALHSTDGLSGVATAAAFEVASQLPLLEELRLHFTGFDGGVMQSLRSMPRLRKVWLGEGADVAAFRRALPHLAVAS